MAEATKEKIPPSITTLPAELIRLVVSNLAPKSGRLRNGDKQDLKNANLAHRCFHQWAPEFMFRDMALQHVLVGMSSHLERFGITPGNEHLLKLVKHICVQVPPALRWEIGMTNRFSHHLEELTAQRLCNKFRVKTPVAMNTEELEYCSEFYHAMVEPFTDNRSWYRLLRTAEASFSRTFKLFTNLEEVSVDSCDIVDQPSPTYTNTFVLQHGRDVQEELDPPFIKDDCVNISWASSIVAKAAPSHVRTLTVALANLDNYNSFATVNRLLSLGYRQSTEKITFARKIHLRLKGTNGTHGTEDYSGDSGSAGPVRYWSKVLNNAPNLQHLEITNDFDEPGILAFSEAEMTDERACIVEWMLPSLQLSHLQTLSLHDLRLDVDKVENTLSGKWPRLETLVLSNISLQKNAAESTSSGNMGEANQELIEHLHGQCWTKVCQDIIHKQPSVRVKVCEPYTSVTKDYKQYRPHPKYIEQLAKLVHVELGSEWYDEAKVYDELHTSDNGLDDSDNSGSQ